MLWILGPPRDAQEIFNEEEKIQGCGELNCGSEVHRDPRSSSREQDPVVGGQAASGAQSQEVTPMVKVRPQPIAQVHE